MTYLDPYAAAAKKIDEIDGSDPERAHCEADDIILGLLTVDVQRAYRRLVERCRWWACA